MMRLPPMMFPLFISWEITVFTCHVHDFNDHVVRSEVELLIELNAEVAFEHGVRETRSTGCSPS